MLLDAKGDMKVERGEDMKIRPKGEVEKSRR